MHELAVTQGIIKICNDEANKHKFKRILNINIKVGELSGLIPECISFYFNEISKNTVADGANLKVKKIPLRYKCMDCGYEGEIQVGEYTCKECGGLQIKFINGRELYIDTMEVE